MTPPAHVAARPVPVIIVAPGEYTCTVIIVAPGEYTCTVCGETTNEYYCYRCSDAKEHAGRGQWNPTDSDTLVPTISYLHPWEYRTP